MPQRIKASLLLVSGVFAGVASFSLASRASAQPPDNAATPTGDGAARAAAFEAPAIEKRPLLGSAIPAGAYPAPGAPPAPGRDRSGATQDAGLVSMLLPLVSVLGLAAGCAVVLRTALRNSGALAASLGAGGKAPAGILEILGRYPVSRGQSLVLLRLDRRVLLLAQSHGGRAGGPAMTTLAEVADPVDVASILGKVQEAQDGSVTQRFRQLLQQAERGETPVDEPEPFRRAVEGPGGDRAELWDEQAAAETLARPSGAAPAVQPVRPRASDPVRSLRDRIEALKAGGPAADGQGAAA